MNSARTTITGLLAAFLAVTAGAARSTTQDGGHPLVTASISTAADRWDAPCTVAVRFTIAPHWHLYWSNPGDAGLAPAIRWTLPEGFRAEQPRFPTPEKIVADGLISYGYHGELVLLTMLIPPAGYVPEDRDTIRADIDWLVCRESCLPGSAIVRLAVADAARTRNEARIATGRFAQTAPVPWNGTAEGPLSATASRTGEGFTLAFDPHMPADDFYPGTAGDAVIDNASVRVTPGSISVRIQTSASAPPPRSLEGIIIAGSRGFHVSVPVRSTDHNNQPQEE